MKILGYNYRIEIDKTLNELGGVGRHHADRLLIQIAKDLDWQQAESTILHEILEALNFAMQWELPHKDLSALEATLYQTLKANGVDLSPLLRNIAEGNNDAKSN